ncbi:hypothetical protein HDV05_005577 [Chytridiales sp. JEL 0842]|nr:hypothetical protein HDV05_005577 [Chytridiales sp. JEL 0842]
MWSHRQHEWVPDDDIGSSLTDISAYAYVTKQWWDRVQGTSSALRSTEFDRSCRWCTQAIVEFMSVAGSTWTDALDFLEAAEWDMQKAQRLWTNFKTSGAFQPSDLLTGSVDQKLDMYLQDPVWTFMQTTTIRGRPLVFFSPKLWKTDDESQSNYNHLHNDNFYANFNNNSLISTPTPSSPSSERVTAIYNPFQIDDYNSTSGMFWALSFTLHLALQHPKTRTEGIIVLSDCRDLGRRDSDREWVRGLHKRVVGYIQECMPVRLVGLLVVVDGAGVSGGWVESMWGSGSGRAVVEGWIPWGLGVETRVSTLEDLDEHVARDSLPKDFGGSLVYKHKEWLADQRRRIDREREEAKQVPQNLPSLPTLVITTAPASDTATLTPTEPTPTEVNHEPLNIVEGEGLVKRVATGGKRSPASPNKPNATPPTPVPSSTPHTPPPPPPSNEIGTKPPLAPPPSKVPPVGPSNATDPKPNPPTPTTSKKDTFHDLTSLTRRYRGSVRPSSVTETDIENNDKGKKAVHFHEMTSIYRYQVPPPASECSSVVSSIASESSSDTGSVNGWMNGKGAGGSFESDDGGRHQEFGFGLDVPSVASMRMMSCSPEPMDDEDE